MRVVAIMLALALAACAQTETESAPPAAAPAAAAEVSLIERGQAIAETICSTCHAIGADDESRNPDAPPLRTLSERYPVNALEEAFAEGVLVGHPSMPEFQFEPDEIDAIVAYLTSIQERRGG